MKKKKLNLLGRMKREWPLHLMILPCIILLFIFCYYPMAGIVIAFKKYSPRLGMWKSPWVGLQNFTYIFKMENTPQIIFNTVFIAFLKMVGGLVVPIVFAILLDQVRSNGYKKSIQTIIYIPYFLSWIVLSGILIDILSPSTGIVNSLLHHLGMKEVFFLGSEKAFPLTMVVSDIWKNFGYGTIIYLAAITSIDQGLYEAARMDGANRLQQIWHVTLPGILPVIVLMTTLSLGNILNAGFDQILNLYNPSVYSTGDIIDTFVYRIGLVSNKFEIATAMGLFKSLVSLVFIATGYRLAYKLAGYKVF